MPGAGRSASGAACKAGAVIRPDNPDAPRFMMDHMAIKLGKYLRLLGYDAVWEPRIRTHALIARANAEGRVFVTGNRHLADRYPAARRVLVLTDADPVRQLHRVVAELDLDPRAGLFSKCIRCNTALEAVPDPALIRARVHPNVATRYTDFFTCPVCHAVFWHGSHVRNTRRKLSY